MLDLCLFSLACSSNVGTAYCWLHGRKPLDVFPRSHTECSRTMAALATSEKAPLQEQTSFPLIHNSRSLTTVTNYHIQFSIGQPLQWHCRKIKNKLAEYSLNKENHSNREKLTYKEDSCKKIVMLMETERTSLCRGWQSTGTVRSWNLPLWRHSNPPGCVLCHLLEVSLPWEGGWAGWTAEVPSNPTSFVILW